MEKYGKKISLTEQEKKDLELGNISSFKQTKSYKDAVVFFKEECAKILEQGFSLAPETHLFFDEKEYATKMRFVPVVSETQNNSEILKKFKDIFGDFGF